MGEEEYIFLKETFSTRDSSFPVQLVLKDYGEYVIDGRYVLTATTPLKNPRFLASSTCREDMIAKFQETADLLKRGENLFD